MTQPLRIAVFAAALALTGIPFSAGAGDRSDPDRAARDFPHIDEDGDGKISRAEWLRRGNFDRLDENKDGFISLDELGTMYDRHAWKEQEVVPKPLDASPAGDVTGKISPSDIDNETLCGIGRFRRCEARESIDLGMLATGLGPRFPDHALCRGIDDYWAMPYSSKRRRESYHGGIDLPVPWGTPVRAVAAGTIVAKYEGEDSARGMEIVLRHAPEDTGLPLWTYSGYGHLDGMPAKDVGQRVAMGEVLAPTGNSGKNPMRPGQPTRRRPAIHLSLMYAETDKFADVKDTVIPLGGHWMDPHAFYRGKAPFDSKSLKALPDAEKEVTVPVMYEDGATEPAFTKVIWPYLCRRQE